MATETAVDVVMPQMGVSVSEGTITRWLKQEGEQVEADEPLLEISTDKVDTEVPSPASGTLTQILVQEGETVEVGTKLAQIGGSAPPRLRADSGAGAARPSRATQPAARRPTPRRPPRRRADRARAVRRSAAAAPAADRERQGLRLPGRRAHRGRARGRPVAGSRHRPRRPRDEAGHPRVHRVRRRSAAPPQPARLSPQVPAAPLLLHRPPHRRRHRLRRKPARAGAVAAAERSRASRSSR